MKEKVLGPVGLYRRGGVKIAEGSSGEQREWAAWKEKEEASARVEVGGKVQGMLQSCVPGSQESAAERRCCSR